MGLLTTEAIPGWRTGTWTLDPYHSSIGFEVRHLGISKVRGTFHEFQATITTGPRIEDTTADVHIKVDSVDTGQEPRDQHLRTGDFFLAAEYPEITFVSTGVRNDDEPALLGDLTIRGVTKPVVLLVDFGGIVEDDEGNPHLGFEATTTIDRKDFGIVWNNITKAGDITVGDKVKILIEAQAVLAPGA